MALSQDKNFVRELTWRGMLHDIIPGTEEHLLAAPTRGYVGIDPTASSLHIGHLVSVMIMRHFQRCGHQPVIVVGGATAMIGDPSGKSKERNLLSQEIIAENCEGIKAQLSRLLNFEGPDAALMVNNYDWMGRYSFLGFIRDIGKHLTVNYMMAKDSVKRRLTGEAGEGLSFTEFSYQLIQATDFLELNRTHGVTLQLGGADQWGNITSGVELIRRIDAKEVFGLTCPLITKADGTKFGKTESGNIWLDPARTSPYQFYQFWLNTSDEDAARYIKIYSAFGEAEIADLVARHSQAPHKRLLQDTLATEVTTMVHGEAETKKAKEASQILFGGQTHEALMSIAPETLLEVFSGVPTHAVSHQTIANGIECLALLTEATQVFPSKGELRRTVTQRGLSINRTKVETPEQRITLEDAIAGKYILVQRGKKEYHLIQLVD